MKNLLIGLAFALILVGCGNKDEGPPLNAEQQAQASQLDVLAKKSGGDWDKLSDDDKKAMIVIGGSEQGAKMLLLGKAGKVGKHGAAGGPGAPGGAAGGPPNGTPSKPPS